MQLGPTKILICPFCGSKKGVITLLSGNTIDGTVWSDTRRHYPMMPELSPIQKCPHCSKFYFIEQAESHYTDDITLLQDSDGGIKNLSVAEALMAVKQMESISLTKTQRWELRHQYFLAYNDAYRRHPAPADSSPTPEEKEMFHKAIDGLLEGIDRTDEFILFHAELLRETARFDEALQILTQNQNPDDRWVAERMKAQISRRNTLPFLLINQGQPISTDPQESEELEASQPTREPEAPQAPEDPQAPQAPEDTKK
ncbi:MAG: hypothetical protein ACI304_01210 [Lepagella sp.]